MSPSTKWVLRFEFELQLAMFCKISVHVTFITVSFPRLNHRFRFHSLYLLAIMETRPLKKIFLCRQPKHGGFLVA